MMSTKERAVAVMSTKAESEATADAREEWTSASRTSSGDASLAAISDTSISAAINDALYGEASLNLHESQHRARYQERESKNSARSSKRRSADEDASDGPSFSSPSDEELTVLCVSYADRQFSRTWSSKAATRHSGSHSCPWMVVRSEGARSSPAPTGGG